MSESTPHRLVIYGRFFQFCTHQKQGMDDNRPLKFRMKVAIGSTVMLHLTFASQVIYEPKVRYHEGNKSPPRASDSLLGWVPPLLYTSELELLDKIGLDAVTFLRFQRLLRWLFTGTAALAGCILIPINVSFNHKFVDPKRRDILSILTIRDVTGNFLYAHVVVTYLITVLVIYCVNIHWREMVKLRSAWFRSPEYLHSFYARTLQVRHVPKKDQSDDGLKSIFESLNVPYPITNVHIGRKVGKLQDLIDKHNKTVREFEEILVKYLKGGRIKPNRPTIRIGGFCGCRGERKDAIEFYTLVQKEENPKMNIFSCIFL